MHCTGGVRVVKKCLVTEKVSSEFLLPYGNACGRPVVVINFAWSCTYTTYFYEVRFSVVLWYSTVALLVCIIDAFVALLHA